LRLWSGPSTIVGIDSWQALLLSLSFVRLMLEAEISRGAVFHWPDETNPIGLEELFGSTSSNRTDVAT
jgi:hypothetical protein